EGVLEIVLEPIRLGDVVEEDRIRFGLEAGAIGFDGLVELTELKMLGAFFEVSLRRLGTRLGGGRMGHACEQNGYQREQRRVGQIPTEKDGRERTTPAIFHVRSQTLIAWRIR